MALIRKYDQELLRYMNLFEQISRIQPRDCFVGENIVFFLTEHGTTQIAIGRQGTNVLRTSDAIKREVKVLDWADTPEGLVKSYLFPIDAGIKINPQKEVEVQLKTSSQRRYLLCDRQKKLRQLIQLIQHYFPDIKNIKIL